MCASAHALSGPDHLARPGAPAFAFCALGVLPMGLFHAGPGAFPRPDAPAGRARVPPRTRASGSASVRVW